MAPLCTPPLMCCNNQPSHQWDVHHHRAEGFGGRAPWPGVGADAADYWSLGRFQGFGTLYACLCKVDRCGYEATKLSRRRSSITVHPQSTVFASARSGYERCGIHALREVTKLEELVPRVLRIGGWRGIRVNTCSECSLPHLLGTPILRPFLP